MDAARHILEGGRADVVHRFDTVVAEAFERLRGYRPVDRLFYGASAVGDHGMIWVMLGALRGLRGDHHWRAAVRGGAGGGVEAVVVNARTKALFPRPGPGRG